MGYRDPQGYLHLVDRKSNMIISGGENIYPSEIEGVLCTHEWVQDAAVVGVPDDKWGEAVYAFVVFKGNRSMAANELSDWCATQLARFKVPRYFAFIAADQIPRNATGKVLHRELRKRAQQHLAEGKVN
ncbi:MAG: class I adenylate-forming enzyme family protein [Burkholderiaceae bacterium]